jgi:hypothetical protein
LAEESLLSPLRVFGEERYEQGTMPYVVPHLGRIEVACLQAALACRAAERRPRNPRWRS